MSDTKSAKKDEIVFFGEVDRHPKGGFSSEYPAWYFENQLNDLKEELKGKEGALQLRLGDNAELAFQVGQLKTRIKDIESSNKKLTSAQTDRLSKYVNEVGEQLRDHMPPLSDMKRGLADAHVEVKKMTTPCIKVPKELADAAGIRLHRGMATRDAASKAWKIGRRKLGEESNTERLRREKLGGFVGQ
jgi:hypothetical protein